jgi:hypothetical protein
MWLLPLGAVLVLVLLAVRFWPVEGRTFLVAGDLTGSYRPPPLAQGLGAVVEDCLQPGCTLQAVGLDDLSSAPVVLYEGELAVPDGLEDGPLETYVEEQVGSVGHALDEAMEPRAEEQCSDVVGTFTAAADALDGVDGERRLVVMSDMVTSCDPWNVTDLEPGASAVQPLLAEMRAAGVIPDLSGIQVRVVVGDQTGELRRLADELGVHLDPTVLKAFWSAFLEEAGADIDDPGWWGSGYSA